MSTLGTRLREMRIKRNLTQAQLGAMCRCDGKTICAIEKDSQMPLLFTVAEIAKQLDVDLHWIVFGRHYGIDQDFARM